MAKQTSTAAYDGIEIELTTEGPEAQEGHDPGSDVLHVKLLQAIEDTVREHDNA